MEKKQRIFSLDAVKIVSILLAIMLHSSRFFVQFSKGSFDFVFGSVLDSLSRIGVPMFVMTTGVLMLNENKEITVKKTCGKYILPMVKVFAVWTVIYYFISCISDTLKGSPIDLRHTVYDLLTGASHMWYLYMLIGLYLVTPILKKFVNKENKELVFYYIVISLVARFTLPLFAILGKHLDAFNQLAYIIDGFYLDFFSGYVTYYLTGWYIFNVGFNKRTENVIYGLSLVSAALIVFYVIASGKTEFIYDNINLLVYLYASGVFLFITKKLRDKPCKSKTIQKMSELGFGVYIVHMAVLSVLELIMPKAIPFMIRVLLYFALTTFISYAGCYLVSKLKNLRWIIRM